MSVENNSYFLCIFKVECGRRGWVGRKEYLVEKSNGKEQITGISEDQKEPNIILVKISSHSLFLQPVGHGFSF